jgi:hypothetical protein
VSDRRLYQVAPRRRAHAELALAGEVAREVAVGTLKTRYPAYKFQVKTKGEPCKSYAPTCP